MSELVLRWRELHDVRLVARRPRDTVLVEFMSSRGVPMLQYATAHPHELRAQRITMEHLKRLIAALPEAHFVQDTTPVLGAPDLARGSPAPGPADAHPEAPAPRLPYVD